MTKRLVWGQPVKRKYEAGVERGVFYPINGVGVAWNGLISVEESSSGGETTSFHFDGIKYLDIVTPSTFQATLTAMTEPEGFAETLGDKSVIPGFILTQQSRKCFDLSYRTMIGNDGDYKLHLIYNVMATPGGRSHTSLGKETTPETRSWTIDAVPKNGDSYRPSSHFIIDSTVTEPGAMRAIEGILYGTETDPARMPRMPVTDELIDIITLWNPIEIIPDLVTGLALLQTGAPDLYRIQKEGFLRALPDSRLYETSVDGIYGME